MNNAKKGTKIAMNLFAIKAPENKAIAPSGVKFGKCAINLKAVATRIKMLASINRFFITRVFLFLIATKVTCFVKNQKSKYTWLYTFGYFFTQYATQQSVSLTIKKLVAMSN